MSIFSQQNHSLAFTSAQKLALAIREKSISSVEVAEAFLAQIDKVNPRINAIAQVDKNRVLGEARQCDMELQNGHLRGLLHGVPISVKDNLVTEGIVTTGGSFAFANNLPKEDATVVRRLRAEGAIILGKTNLPDFALSWETESTAYGRTNNPHDLRRTAGGSSGGESAIIAAGGSPFGIGTDSGGSIRLPAHYCGIAGMRTSHGLIPSTGHMPPAEGCPVLGVFANFNSIGPMARSVNDLLYVLPILMGGDGIDPYADFAPLKKPSSYTIKGLKVAFYTSVGSQPIDHEIEQAVLKTADILKQKGALVTPVEPPGLADARNIYCSIVGADGGAGIRSLLNELGYSELPDCVDKALNLMPGEQTIRTFLDARIQWDLYRIKLLQFMQAYDLILCPVSAFTALPHGQSLTDPEHLATENYLIPYSLMGWPAIAIPAAISSENLPIGVQLIGKFRQDYQVLLTASAIEASLNL